VVCLRPFCYLRYAESGRPQADYYSGVSRAVAQSQDTVCEPPVGDGPEALPAIPYQGYEGLALARASALSARLRALVSLILLATFLASTEM
jgi:hypothetical protein